MGNVPTATKQQHACIHGFQDNAHGISKMQHGFSSMAKHHSIFIIKPNSSSYKYHGITLIRFVQHVTITASMQNWISGKKTYKGLRKQHTCIHFQTATSIHMNNNHYQHPQSNMTMKQTSLCNII